MSTQPKVAIRRMAAQHPPSAGLADAAAGTTASVEHLPWWENRSRNLGEASRTPTARRTQVRRRVLLAGGLATAVTTTAVVVATQLPNSPAYAATPPMLPFASAPNQRTAAEVLTDLAARARIQPPPPGAGKYEYIRTRGWYLATAMDQNMRLLDSGIEERGREQWVAPDGSGRLLMTCDGKPLICGEKQDEKQQDLTLKPGDFSARPAEAESPVESLRSRLMAAHPNTTAYGWLDIVSETWRTYVVSPARQGALLDILATQSDLAMAGTTTDRAGRSGIAVSAVDKRAPHDRMILVFDPETGRLLDSEEIASESGDRPVRVPATVGYMLILQTGYTADTQQRPK